VPGSSCGAIHLVSRVENEEDVQDAGQAGVGAVVPVSPVARRCKHFYLLLESVWPFLPRKKASCLLIPLCLEQRDNG